MANMAVTNYVVSDKSEILLTLQENPEEEKEPFFANYPAALGLDHGASQHVSMWESSWFK